MALAGEILSIILGLDTILLFLVLFIGIILAFKIFKYLMRVFVTGAVFAVFPIVANIMGLSIPLTFESIAWSALFGIIMYMLYTSLMTGTKIVNKILSIAGKLVGAGKPKQKVIIREVVKEDDYKKKR